MELPAGTRIADRYVVLGDIGAGGMGVVLRARDERLGRVVAVKVLPKDALGDDASRKRLLREARAVAALDHPNIVHVYDVGETPDGGAFLVMELVKGKSLGDHLRDGSLSRAQRLHALVDVARALQYAHDQGLLHRDIKPDNVMVRDDGRVVVLDFGLAKIVAPGLGTTVEASLVSSKSAFVGTPAYVSPEQARGDKLDAKTDQFSLAVSMFELLTGELPWEGGTPLEVISHILRGEPKKLRAVHPEASEEVERVLDRALSKRPDDRYPSMGVFADAIEHAAPEIARAPSLREVGIGPSQSLATATIQTLSAPATTKKTSAGPSRSKRAPIVAAVLLALGTGALWFGTHRTPAAAPAPTLDPKTVIACPILRVTDPDLTETGWLGAAAATLLCDRVQAALGGDPERTRIPAELLSLPREPREGFPDAPYEQKDAIDKTIERAKAADAYLDGTLDHGADFRLMLALHAKGGEVLERGEGRGATLVEAVRAAMTPMLPRLERAVDAGYVQKWFNGSTTAGRLAAFDLHVFVLAEDPEGQRAACSSISRADLGSLHPVMTALCAQKLYDPMPPAPQYDASTAGAALTTASALRFVPTSSEGDRQAQRERATRVHEFADRESDLGAKALLLAGEAELYYQLGENHAAAVAARASIQASPKVADLRGNAWHRQSFVSEVDNVAVLAAHVAWLPWEPYAWPNLTRSLDPKDVRGYQRAYLLAQHGYWAVEYGVRLLENNHVVAARGVAATTHNPRLELLLLHAERRPGAALEHGIKALAAIEPKAIEGNTATRVAADVIALGALLGKPVDDAIADYLNRFVFADPPALTHGVTTMFGTLAVCTQSKGALGERCIERVAELFARGWFGGAVLNGKDGIDGARRYVKGDLVGAAKAWRPVVTEFLAESLRVPMALAFEHAGDGDLADKLDDGPIAANVSSPVTELCWVRKALRAEKKGDLALAQKLARTFVDRWDTADERPAAIAEMKRVLARTK